MGDQAWRMRMRRRLYKKQKYCRWCRRKFAPPPWAGKGLFPTIDHVDPKCRGGVDRRSNLCLACEECNKRREHWHPDAPRKPLVHVKKSKDGTGKVKE